MATVGIRFLYTALLGAYDFVNPGSNVISTPTPAAGDHLPVNLTTTPLRETFRTADATGWKEFVLQANNTDEPIDVVGLLYHNLTNLAVVQIQPSLTTDFTGAPTLTFTWSAKHMVLLNDFGTPYNYYKIRILDPTNPCGFIELGRIIGGKSFTMTENEDITDDIQIGQEDLAYRAQTEGFFRASNERVKVDKLAVRFSRLKTTAGENVNYLGLRFMLEEVGITFPFLTILDPEDQTFFILWGQLDSMPGRGFTINRFVDMPLNITEVY